MNDPKQAELLEQFLALLRANAHAAPPPGLDPEIAAFARKLMVHPAPDAALRARVWQRALTAAQVDESKRVRLNGHRQDTLMPLKEHNPMIAAHATPSRKSSTPWFTLIAAALAVTIFGFYLFNLRPDGQRDPGAAVVQQSSETPTPAVTETLVPTASPTWTPTPLPAAASPTLVPANVAVPVPVNSAGGPWHPFVFDTNGAVRLDAGSVISGQLSQASPIAGYTFTAPTDGPFTVYVITDQFQPLVAYTAANNTTAASATASNVVPLTLRAGNNVTFNVTSVNGSGIGPYVLRLESGEPSTATISGSQTVPAIPQVSSASGSTIVTAPSIGAQNPATITLPADSAQATSPTSQQSTLTLAQPSSAGTVAIGSSMMAQPSGENGLSLSTVTMGQASSSSVYAVNAVFSDLADAQGIVPDAPFNGTLTAEKPSALYHFVAKTSGLLNVNARSSSISDLSVFPAAIKKIDSNQPVPMSQPLPPGQIGTFVEAGDDIYIRVGSGSGQQNGTFTLTPSLSPLTPLTFDTPADGNLDESAPSAAYSFEAKSGDVISARVEGKDGFDTRLVLLGDDHTIWASDDDSGDSTNPELQNLVIPHDGTFTLIVQPYNGPYGAAGHFTLTLAKQLPPSLDAGPQAVAFNNKLTPALTFTGKAGETVQLVVRVPSDATEYSVDSLAIRIEQNGEALSVFNRGDGRTPAVHGQGGGVTLLSGPVTIPADGVVTVKLDAAGTLNQTDGLRLEVALEK